MTGLNVVISHTEVGHSPSLDISSLCHTECRCVRQLKLNHSMLRLCGHSADRVNMMSNKCTVNICCHWLRVTTCLENL